MGGGSDNGGEKRNALIVSVLLPIAFDLALRSNMQRRVDVLRVCQVAILQGLAANPITLRDAEVEDQAPAAGMVSQVVQKLHVPCHGPALALTPVTASAARTLCGPLVRERVSR